MNESSTRNVMHTWAKQRVIAIDACMSEQTPYGDAKGNEIMLQERGGPCPFCGKPLVAVVGKNMGGSTEFTYYVPTCHCFRTCWTCGRVMMAERFMEPPQAWCGNCSSEPVRKAAPKPKLSDRTRDGKMASAGENS